MSSFHANLSSQTAEFFRHSSEPSQINLAEKNVTSQGAGQGDNSKSLDEPTTLSSQGYEPTADEVQILSDVSEYLVLTFHQG
ncbi:hypothetical protein An12g03810 [Aspergillus niger]|uniref:Uncharacterized protein n=2 Tax=Aspergillus niger TaxID=5061 RepID=A2QZ67_ASPNC|nr:hypothetical protein An12g03810 [Aspergillus niger]CAK46152.1 hypothetical protein An12g03810 [Aspergillus niger]